MACSWFISACIYQEPISSQKEKNKSQNTNFLKIFLTCITDGTTVSVASSGLEKSQLDVCPPRSCKIHGERGQDEVKMSRIGKVAPTNTRSSPDLWPQGTTGRWKWASPSRWNPGGISASWRCPRLRRASHLGHGLCELHLWEQQVLATKFNVRPIPGKVKTKINRLGWIGGPRSSVGWFVCK